MTSSAIPKYFQTMSSAPPEPQPSALPPSSNTSPDSSTTESSKASSSGSPTVKPQRKPLLRLELRDLSSSGSRAFLRLLHASTTLEEAVDTVLTLLYTDLKTDCIPPTRSVTLVLRSMSGVAYTTGLDIDNDHKEIHFSTNYISQVSESRQKEEMQGVLVHEMVHCWQHNGYGTAPGGLIEGIADWVRLKAGYAPPHWKRHADKDWDSGYERTAYFLEWLEKEHGSDIVRRINEGLRESKYEEEPFWNNCCGKAVSKLWEEYRAHLGGGEKGEQSQAERPADGGMQQPGEKQTDCSINADSRASGCNDADSAADYVSDNDIPDQDNRNAREKARRGGNMHVPVRPPFP